MELRNRRKERMGVVIKDKMDKGIVVRIDRITKHPVYKRIMKKSSRITVHDEKNEARVGDKVMIQETRPMSKNKRWRLREILK